MALLEKWLKIWRMRKLALILHQNMLYNTFIEQYLLFNVV